MKEQRIFIWDKDYETQGLKVFLETVMKDFTIVTIVPTSYTPKSNTIDKALVICTEK